ncbi:MAG: zinc-binding alcohol dehydrogenase family protein [Edaphobacter sp.]|uniref:zinc-binding alcohol dehydrogenase family protein n=1 Tax=Edaphobacter sp. TaxID=1934404 RepID=UPI0023882526|nr:zinc-binding alcohol dehydrogenase family protein [Edaphobacter sp.]MDE1178688.1 zinc-binding alcohol dehydrogenase family protein [Edaphobacter sp.]
MKAVGYKKPLPVTDADSLLDITLPDPVAKGRDLLVEVKAISVNPVDYKVRGSSGPLEGDEYRVVGWDATGVVKAVGEEVTLFKPGDEVFYAGSRVRQGANAELHLVDERIVGHKPKSLDFAQAAALPLTSLTAWELLFDRLGVKPGKPADAGSLLIIGGSGGVGSMMIQLARRLTGMAVIATASRPETQKWCLELGAHHVIDHSQPLAAQMKAIGIPEAEYIVSLTATDQHYPALIEVLAPQGHLGVIDDPATLDAKPLKQKAAALHWELMFTRSFYQTHDMAAQHRILNEVADLVDEGILRTTVAHSFGTINAANLRKAHELLESGKSHGKIVLAGF